MSSIIKSALYDSSSTCYISTRDMVYSLGDGRISLSVSLLWDPTGGLRSVLTDGDKLDLFGYRGRKC